MKTKIGFLIAVIATLGVLMAPIPSHAESQTSITPINEELSLKKSTLTMTVPEDNKLPWGVVHGAASVSAERHPIIIQFFNQDDEMVHVAQVEPKGDGSYDYRFRVLNVDENGEIQRAFEGEYTVVVYRVIPNTNQIV